MRRTILLSTALLLAITTPAFAGPSEDIAKLVKDATESPEPLTAVLQGFAALPNFQLDGKSVDAAIRAGGAPKGGLVDQLLGSLISVKKNGDRVEIHRTSSVT